MSDLQWMSVGDMLEQMERGWLSAREALDHHIAWAEEHDDRFNLVVSRDVDQARATATAIDDARAGGRPVGRLGGLPMTVKDSLQTEGLRTTSGSPTLADFVPEIDAAPVARLREAGAIIWGKTNLPMWAGDVQTYNEVFGTSNNPWDVTRSVGGSSGGSAGALAAGYTALEVGSDIGGSIRNPAAMCGVVGHKPSYGIVSARGQIPGAPGTLTEADIAVVGPMARTVDDCVLALDVLAGADEWHRTAWSLDLPPPRTTDVSGLRVAVWPDDAHCPVDPEIRRAILEVAAHFSAAGADVNIDARPTGVSFDASDEIFWNLLGAALAGGSSSDEIEASAAALAQRPEAPRPLGVTGATGRHRFWLSNNERRLQLRQRWREFFARWDVVLAPVSPTVAIPHDHAEPMMQRTIDVAGTPRPYTDQMAWMGLFGVVYLPVTSVPIGLHSTGLPIGMQVVAPFLEDHMALTVASIVEEMTGGYKRPPHSG